MSSPGANSSSASPRTPSSCDDNTPIADLSACNSMPSSGASTPDRISKFDSLPKDKLIAYLKKQMMVQQKSKMKLEEMDKEMKNDKLKFDKLRSDLILNNEILQTQMNAKTVDFTEKLAELDEKLKQSEQSLQLENCKHKDVRETLECIRAQNETLTSSYHQLQLEYEESKDKLSPATQITDAEELVHARRQLEEWERMMAMLQADRDSTQDHLAKLQKVETANRTEIDELTEALNLALADRDLANSNSQKIENESKLSSEKAGKLEKLSKRMAEEVKKQKHIITTQKDKLAELKSTCEESISSKNECDTIISKLKSLIKKMQDDKQDHIDSNQEYSNKLEEFEEKELSYVERAKQLSNRIDELELKEKELIMKAVSDADRIQELQDVEKELKKKVEESSTELRNTNDKEFESSKQSQETIERLEDQVNELLEKSKVSLDKIKEFQLLEDELTDSKSKICELEKREIELIEQVKQDSVQIKHLEDCEQAQTKETEDKSQSSEETMQAKLSELQQLLADQEERYAEHSEKTDRMRSKFESQAQEMQTNLRISVEERDQLAQKSSSREVELGELNEELRKSRESHSSTLNQITADKRELEDDKKTLMLNLARLRDEFDVAMAEVASLEELQARVEKEASVTKDLLSEQKKINEQLILDHADSSVAVDQLVELKSSLAVHEQSAAFAASQLADVEARLQQALQRADAAAPENAALVEKLGEMATMRAERDSALEQLAEMNRRLDENTICDNKLTEENCALRQEIAAGNSELTEIADRVQTLTQEHQRYRAETQQELNRYAARTEDSETELVEIREAFKDATKTIEMMKNESHDANLQLKHLEEENSQKKYSDEDYINLNEKLKTVEENMIQERNEYQDKFEEEKKNAEIINKKNLVLENTVNDLQENIKTLQNGKDDSESLEREFIESDKKVKELNVLITNNNCDFESYKANTNNEIESLKSKNNDLMEDIENMKLTKKQFEDEAITHKEILNKSITELNNKCVELMKEYELKLTDASNVSVKEKEAFEQHKNQLINELSETRTLLQTQSEQYKDLEKEKTTIIETIEINSKDMAECKNNLEEKLRICNVEIETLNRNIEELNSSHEKAILQLTDQLQSLNSDAKEMQNNVDIIKDKAENKEKQMLEEHQSHLTKLNKEFNNKLASMEDEIKNNEDIIEQLKADNLASVNSMSSNSTEVLNELTSLRQEYSDYKLDKDKECDTYANENSLKLDIINKLHKELNDMKEIVEEQLLKNNCREIERDELQTKLDQLNGEFSDFKQSKEKEINNNKTKMEMDTQKLIEELQCEHMSIEKSSKTKLQNCLTEIDELKITHEKERDQLTKECKDVKIIIQSETESFNSELTTLNNKIKEIQKQNEQLVIENKGIQDMNEDGNNKNKELIDQLEEVIKLKEQQRIKDLKELTDKYDDCKSRENVLLEKVDKLENASQRGNVYELEIADYQRTVKSLQETIAVSQKCAEDRQAIIADSNNILSTSKAQNEKLEKKYNDIDVRCKKLKLILMKTKKELAESKDSEMQILKEKEEIESQMQSETCDTEEWKMKLSLLASENVKLKELAESVREDKDRNQAVLKEQLESLNESLANETKMKEAITSEYDLYKIRVHGVLKQQKTKVQIDEELNEQIHKVITLEEKICRLNESIEKANDHNEILTNEITALTTDRDRAASKLEYALNASKRKETSFEERIKHLEMMSNNAEMKHENSIRKINNEHSALLQKAKDAENMSLEKIKLKEIEIQELNEKILALKISEKTQSLSENAFHPIAKKELTLSIVPNPSLSSSSVERGERPALEGQEVENNMFTRKISSELSPLPFENLLTDTELAESKMVLESVEDYQTLLQQKQQLINRFQKDSKNLTELLNDSEATVMRLGDQAVLLKEEVRRHERNQQRDNSVSNMEYLKNVVFKFVTLTSEEEKLQLIPVLKTMLCFSEAEIQQLKIQASMVMTTGQNSTNNEKSWSGYIHRWSGM